MSPPSQEKAKEIIRDGTVHGEPLTPAQWRLFYLIASGKKPTKLKEKPT